MTLSRHYTSLIFMYFVSLQQRMTENLSQEQLNAVPVRQILFKGSISTWKKKPIKICENGSYLFPNSAHHLAWLGKCTRPCKDCCRLGTQRLEFGMKLLPWWLSRKMNTIRNSLFNSMVHSLNFLKNFTILSNISSLVQYVSVMYSTCIWTMHII